MPIRVPLLLGRVAAVIHRLDPVATAAVDPPGSDAVGYDADFREPVAYDSGGTRESTRRELTAVRVPCQVETDPFRVLQQTSGGDAAGTVMVLVTHRADLERLGLLDVNQQPVIRVNDRVSALERVGAPGVVAQALEGEGLFVQEVRPGSWGFGTAGAGHDLELLVLGPRPKGV